MKGGDQIVDVLNRCLYELGRALAVATTHEDRARIAQLHRDIRSLMMK